MTTVLGFIEAEFNDEFLKKKRINNEHAIHWILNFDDFHSMLLFSH